MRFAQGLFAISVLLSRCSQPPPERRVYQAGEQVRAGHLTYTVLDSRIVSEMGDDAANARLPKDRFYVIQVSVAGSGTDTPIPAMALVDDNGRTYNELTDGAGAGDWLGVVRDVKPAQTVEGSVLFDAPVQHYRLRLTGKFEQPEISIDLPLSFVHQQIGVRDQLVQPSGGANSPGPEPGK